MFCFVKSIQKISDAYKQIIPQKANPVNPGVRSGGSETLDTAAKKLYNLTRIRTARHKGNTENVQKFGFGRAAEYPQFSQRKSLYV